MANSLNKKEFIYNKIQDTFDQYDNWSRQSIDEIVEQNSNSISVVIAYLLSNSTYKYYDVDKASIYGPIRMYGGKNYHGIRPLFFFKE